MYLLKYPEYLDQFFPTLLRSEKTHLWGYFSTPSGHLLAIHTGSPVSPYTLEYEKDAQGIFTASVNLLQSGKLPLRHPQNLNGLEAGECRRWKVVLTPIERAYDLEAVKPALAAGSSLAVAEADLYTIGEGEERHLAVYSRTPLRGGCLTGADPEGGRFILPVKKTGAGRYGTVFRGGKSGLYTLDAINESGYQVQMCLTVRNRWSWYLTKAAQAMLYAPQKATSHAGSWYGFYTGYLARKHLPDPGSGLCRRSQICAAASVAI